VSFAVKREQLKNGLTFFDFTASKEIRAVRSPGFCPEFSGSFPFTLIRDWISPSANSEIN